MARPQPGEAMWLPGPDEWEVEVSPTLLFRYSALTYNAHRIHYDRDFCRDVEGYPGLLVHGPLQATLMAEAARRRGVATSGRVQFDYRLLSPTVRPPRARGVSDPDRRGLGHPGPGPVGPPDRNRNRAHGVSRPARCRQGTVTETALELGLPPTEFTALTL